jgi:hypothetical protein
MEDKFRLIEIQQQQSQSDMKDMRQTLTTMMALLQNSNHSTSTMIGHSHSSAPAHNIASASPSIAAQMHVPSIQVARQQVNEQVQQSSKSLFNLSAAQQSAIANYGNSGINSTFDDDANTTIDMSGIEQKATNVSGNVHTNANTMPSFISALLPTPANANEPTIADLLQSGLKIAAKAHEHKIKSVEDLLMLLSEQAKHLIQNEGDVGDFMLYSLNLIKLLTEYGLQAVLEYHFELMKQIQSGQITKLHGDHPMIYIRIITKYTRLNNYNMLQSQKINSTPSNNKPYGKQAVGRTNKFTGIPCPYHTKLLGKSANHSESECNQKAKHGTTTKQ